MQRARLVEQVRLAEATRTILHTAGRDLNLARLIEDCVAPIVQGLRTHGMWIRAFAADSRTAGGYGAVHPPQISLDAPEQVLDLAGRIATACWDQQRAVVLAPPPPRRPTWCRRRSPRCCWSSSAGSTRGRCSACRWARAVSAWATWR